MLDFDEANLAICRRITSEKLNMIKDYDIDHRPGFRVVLEEHLQMAKNFALKEYKVQKRYVESNNMSIDDAINHIKERCVELVNLEDITKHKETDDFDAPVGELWGYIGAYEGLQILMRQLTEGSYKKL